MDKNTNVQEIFKMAEMINKRNIKQPEEKITVVEVEPDNKLPTTYMNGNQLKLSTKDVVHTVSYLDRLKQRNEKQDQFQYTEDQGKKIRKGMLKLSTGVVSVAPLKCTGDACPFNSTCLSGDTSIMIKGGSTKKIRDLKIGDIVYSFNTSKNRLELDSIIDTNTIADKKLFLIQTKFGNSIKATEDHRFLSLASKQKYIWSSLEDGLKVGSAIIVTDFDDDLADDIQDIEDVFIDYIKKITPLKNDTVYDITIKKNSNFIANNIVVHNCPYWTVGAAPVGEPCEPEAQLIEYWMAKYIAEFNIDENSITDMHMIARLCTFDIYEMRLHRYLSEHDQTILVDFVSSYDEEGNPISNKATSAAFDTIDKIDRMRSKTLKELMATREAKTKIVNTINNAKQAFDFGELKAKFEELAKQKASIKTVNEND